MKRHKPAADEKDTSAEDSKPSFNKRVKEIEKELEDIRLRSEAYKRVINNTKNANTGENKKPE